MGSTAMPLVAVEPRVDEVAHAGNYQSADAVVVDHVEIRHRAVEAPTATGGGSEPGSCGLRDGDAQFYSLLPRAAAALARVDHAASRSLATILAMILATNPTARLGMVFGPGMNAVAGVDAGVWPSLGSGREGGVAVVPVATKARGPLRLGVLGEPFAQYGGEPVGALDVG